MGNILFEFVGPDTAWDWLENDRPDSDRNSLVPVRCAPEPSPSELIAILARLTSVALIYWNFALVPPKHEARNEGQRLHCGSTTLIHPETRPGELERLLGLGRLNRWTSSYGGLGAKALGRFGKAVPKTPS